MAHTMGGFLFPIFRNQGLLLFPAEPFDFDFPLQSIGMGAAGFPVDQFQRAAATGVFRTFSALMCFKALFHICGDPGVQRAVLTAQDI